MPLMSKVPGFVAYYLVGAGNNIVASIGMFETREGAAAADRLACEWFRTDWPTFIMIPPELTAGEVMTHSAANRDGGLRIMRDGWNQVERRSGRDRRWGRDRREAKQAAYLPTATAATP